MAVKKNFAKGAYAITALAGGARVGDQKQGAGQFPISTGRGLGGHIKKEILLEKGDSHGTQDGYRQKC